MMFKLNTDASFHSDGSLGLGMVIRDCGGKVLGAKIIKGLDKVDVEVAEEEEEEEEE